MSRLDPKPGEIFRRFGADDIYRVISVIPGRPLEGTRHLTPDEIMVEDCRTGETRRMLSDPFGEMLSEMEAIAILSSR